MADSARYLSFSNLENEQPVVGFCSLCGKRFEAQPEAGMRIDSVILRVRSDFEKHQCKVAD